MVEFRNELSGNQWVIVFETNVTDDRFAYWASSVTVTDNEDGTGILQTSDGPITVDLTNVTRYWPDRAALGGMKTAETNQERNELVRRFAANYPDKQIVWSPIYAHWVSNLSADPTPLTYIVWILAAEEPGQLTAKGLNAAKRVSAGSLERALQYTYWELGPGGISNS